MSLLLLLQRGQVSITGSISATETGLDTASVSGKVLISGTISAVETGSDTASFSGAVLITGSLSAFETGQDTASISGNVLITGSVAANETGQDTSAISGNVLISGSIGATEIGNDIAAFNGTTGQNNVSLNMYEAGADIASIRGNVIRMLPPNALPGYWETRGGVTRKKPDPELPEPEKDFDEELAVLLLLAA